MVILENHDLTELNTFGIKAKSKLFCEIETEQDFLELIKTSEFKDNEKLFIGGGSNILFTKDFFSGLVILNKLKGIEILEENSEYVLIKVMSGENWHDLVNFTVDKNFWGIENLALIPGTVGGSPVQNIGAYGVEIKDVLEKVEAFEINTGKKKIFSNSECEFGYRDSVFKNKLKGQYFITAVIFKLNKKPARSDYSTAVAGGENKNIKYKVLEEYIKENNLEIKTSKDVSHAISQIRKTKLPDPKVLGNAGSFFKNFYCYVDDSRFKNLLKKYPDVFYFEEDGKIKIPAGWLIEQCGWKGKRLGNVGVHDKQALVLVNYGNATGQEIFDLSNNIIDSVYKKFGVKLETEVNLI
ncbi:MAG: UDP-N-acetylmuramate dehydrogenase [Patescibacteria group bacterium]